MNPVHEPNVDDIEVIHMTAVEWDQALTRSLNDVGLTWEQLTEQAKTGDFASLKARQLWLMAGGQGPNQASVELAKWKAKAEFAEGAAVNNRERADQFRQERDEARRELAEAQAAIEALELHINDIYEIDRRAMQMTREQRDKARDERDALKAQLAEIAMAKVWTNEDGKRFVFADDLAGILLPDLNTPAPTTRTETP